MNFIYKYLPVAKCRSLKALLHFMILPYVMSDLSIFQIALDANDF